jgi:rod shape-determining protein MreD
MEIFVIYVALVLQMVLSPSIPIAGVTPDIVFAVVVSLAAFRGCLRGSAYGAGAGIMLDLIFLHPGFYSLQYTLSGALSGLVSIRKSARFMQPVIICMPAYFIKEAVTLILIYLDGASVEWLSMLRKISIGALYTAAIAFLIYALTEFIYRKARLKRDTGFIFTDSF